MTMSADKQQSERASLVVELFGDGQLPRCSRAGCSGLARSRSSSKCPSGPSPTGPARVASRRSARPVVTGGTRPSRCVTCCGRRASCAKPNSWGSPPSCPHPSWWPGDKVWTFGQVATILVLPFGAARPETAGPTRPVPRSSEGVIPAHEPVLAPARAPAVDSIPRSSIPYPTKTPRSPRPCARGARYVRPAWSTRWARGSGTASGAAPPRRNAAASSASAAAYRLTQPPMTLPGLGDGPRRAHRGPVAVGPRRATRRWPRSWGATPRPAQIAAFIVALRMKGETVEELAGLLAAMLDAAERVPLDDVSGVVDTCGTGGDRSHTINVSTLAALVVAGAGVRVCKHGNRAASSECGSADLLEALGVAIELAPEAVAQCVDRGRHRVLLRTPVPPGHAPRRPDPAGAGRADGVQLPRTYGEPGPGAAPGDRRERPGHGRAHGPGAGGQRVGAGVGRARGRRPRRAHHHHTVHAAGDARRRAVPADGGPRCARLQAVRGRRPAGRRRRPAMRTWRDASSTASPDRTGTSSC